MASSSKTPLLDGIREPHQLRALSKSDLRQFAEELRTELIDVVGGSVLRGRAAIRDFAAGQLAAFSDFQLRRLHLVIEGDANADQWEMTGTNDGELFGLAPTGRPVRLRGATFSEFDESGLVVRDTHYIDYNSLLAQLSGD